MAVVTPASPAEYPAACRLLFAALPDREVRSARALTMLQSGELDPAGLLVLRGPDLLGAVLYQIHPGNVAIVWPPQGNSRPNVDELADAVVERLTAAEVKQAQCLLPLNDVPRATPLVRAGFRRVTDLSFLGRPVLPADAEIPPTTVLTFRPAEVDLSRFGDTLLATYENTLDCPELNGTRSAEEMLAGYRKGAGPAPTWLLAYRETDAIGVVLIAPGPQPGNIELTYLGLVASARGCGLGDELMRCVVRQAATAAAEWILLTADVRNAPALRLYGRHGFRPYDMQAVFLWTPPA